MGNFTVEAARAQPGPDWLVGRRASAAEAFAAGPLPTPSEEAWRYSRIDQIDLDRYVPAAHGGSVTLAGSGTPGGIGGHPLAPGRVGVEIRAGESTSRVTLDESLVSKGVEVTDVTGLAERPSGLGSCSDASADAFVHLNDAFAGGAVLIRIPAGVVVEAPIEVHHHLAGTGVAVFPRTVVEAGEDSEVTVLERFTSADDEARLVVPVTELIVGHAARVSYLSVQDHGAATTQIALVRARVGRDATVRSSAVALGGDYARLRSESLLEGAGGRSEMVAVYFANETQMLDFRTLQDHAAHHTTSDLLFKGAVEDEARSVYSGLVRLRPEAQRAVASQTNRNLVLSSGAAAESIPNLEIEANDVRCAHASAVGPIDPDQLYYLESRGIPPVVAERLIVFGFFEDVIERLPVGEMAGRLREAVRIKFDARRIGTQR